VNAVFPPICANVLHQEVCLKFYGQVSICQAIAHNCKCGDGGKQLTGPIGYRPGLRNKHVLYRAEGQLSPPPDDTNPVVLAHNASSVQWPLDDPARFCRLLYMKNIYISI